MKSAAAILATAMFVGDRTTASPLLAGAAAVVQPCMSAVASASKTAGAIVDCHMTFLIT